MVRLPSMRLHLSRPGREALLLALKKQAAMLGTAHGGGLVAGNGGATRTQGQPLANSQ